MRASSNVVFLLLLFLIQTSQVCYCKSSNSTCSEQERQALLKFRSSFKNTSGSPLASWEGNDCCHWKGVGCHGITGLVIKLDLGRITWGSSVYLLEAEVMSPSLMELEHLNHLDLSGIDFTDSPIPPFLGSMKQLRYLRLSLCGFAGKIPPHLGNLSNLHVLDVSYNERLYDDNMGWVSKLSSLKHLAMDYVSLEKAHNLFLVLHMLPSLLQADFTHCQLTNLHIDPHGPINSTFCSNVEALNLSFNFLNGSIPETFQNMSSIRDLDLSYNFLSSVPPWLGNLQSLVYLDLSGNSINRIEVSIISILRNTCSLQSLDLSWNTHAQRGSLESFGTGTLDGCKRYDLEELFLRESRISDSLPSWLGNLKNLKCLDLANNSIHGQIPSFLGQLRGLRILDLSRNNLFGKIPIDIGALSDLVVLDLSHNTLEGTFSEIHLRNLSSIHELQVGFNNLAVNIGSNWTPPFQFLRHLGMVSCNISTWFPQWLKKQKQLVTLDLSNNSIRGPIPNWIQEMNSIIKLDLSNNKINGSIPKGLGYQKPFLIVLILRSNLIEGFIPDSLCNLTMIVLDLSDNRLSRKIPNCWSTEQTFYIINLSSNKLSGTIPSSFKNFYNLNWLNLGNNCLHGELSQVLKNIPQVENLDLGGNQFSGMIPPTIGQSNIQVLKLSHNLLSDNIPSSLCKLSGLHILDLSANNLSGSIPPCIYNLKGMINQIEDDENVDDGPVSVWVPMDVWNKEGLKQVLKGLELDYIKIWQYLINIDLSNNRLTGLIPEGLTNLSGLIGLNLSHNKFSGRIPSNIGNMKSLESIDLSSNELYGPIPTSMSILTSLSDLNLSNNNFSGRIPEGPQFSTFDLSSYIGNPYLCGDPRSNVCGGDHGTKASSEDKSNNDEDKEKVLFYFVIAVGFITGFWGVIGILVFNRRWRHALFQYVDDFVDTMYVEIMIRVARFKRMMNANQLLRQ